MIDLWPVLTVVMWVVIVVMGLRAALHLTALETCGIGLILSELAKKCFTVATLGSYGKLASLILSAGPAIAALLLFRAGKRGERKPLLGSIGPPFVCLFGLLVSLLVSTAMSQGSFLALLTNVSALFWAVGSLCFADLEPQPQVPKRIFWFLTITVIYGGWNILVGTDPLWASYSTISMDYSVGARFTPDLGYTGSLFSSPSEFGTFILAATAFILLIAPSRSYRFLTTLFAISMLGAFCTGSRAVIFGVFSFWFLVIVFARWTPPLPALLVALLSFPVLQDHFLPTLLALQPYGVGVASPFVNRLTTTGTFAARVGVVDTLSQIVASYPMLGVGAVEYWDPGMVPPDDRHNLILRLIVQAGLPALLFYGTFVYLNLQAIYRRSPAYRPHRVVGLAYILAALLMSFGGPQATDAWFFMMSGVLFGLSTGPDNTTRT